jgi:hypothetical protein
MGENTCLYTRNRTPATEPAMDLSHLQSQNSAFTTAPAAEYGGLAATSRPPLNYSKDVTDLASKLGKRLIEHRTPRMKNHIDRHSEKPDLTACRFAHAPFDPIPIMRLAEHPAYGQAEPGKTFGSITQRLSIGAHARAQGEEVAHLFGKLLSAGTINPQVIRMLTQARGPKTDFHNGMLASAGLPRRTACLGTPETSLGTRR